MNQKDWRCFLNLCLNVKEEKLLSELFDLFLTLEEKSSLSTRYSIIKALISQKKPQRKISEDLNVSIAKITRGSNELKEISPKLRRYLMDQFI